MVTLGSLKFLFEWMIHGMLTRPVLSESSRIVPPNPHIHDGNRFA